MEGVTILLVTVHSSCTVCISCKRDMQGKEIKQLLHFDLRAAWAWDGGYTDSNSDRMGGHMFSI